jgi:tetratricopeptide (TPR) repeat protein
VGFLGLAEKNVWAQQTVAEQMLGGSKPKNGTKKTNEKKSNTQKPATKRVEQKKSTAKTTNPKPTVKPTEKPTQQKITAKVLQKPIQPKPNTKTTNRRRNQKQQPNPNVTSEMVTVTFLTGGAGVEIWSGKKKLGVSDKNARLQVEVKSGNHQIMLKKGGKTLGQVRTVNVSVTQNIINFFPANQNGNLTQAFMPLETTKSEPNNQSSRNETNNGSNNRLIDVAEVLMAYQDPKKTREIPVEAWQLIYFQNMREMVNGNVTNVLQSQTAFAEGQIELANGGIVKAINAFSAATVFTPTSGLAFYGLGNARYADKQYTEAANAYRRAIQLEPKFSLAYEHLADSQVFLNRTKESIKNYQTAIELGNNAPDVRLKLAQSLMREKEWEKAVGELEKLQKDAPSEEVFIALGDSYHKLNRELSAIEAYEKATKANPKSAIAYHRLGMFLLEQKEYEKAKAALQRALDLDPEGKTINRPQVQTTVNKTDKKINEKSKK